MLDVEPVAPGARPGVAGDELPASDVGADERPDIDALFALDPGDVEGLADELPGIVGRGGGFAAGGGDAAGAGRAGGTVGMGDLESGLPAAMGRGFAAALAGVAEIDGFLAAAELDAGVCALVKPEAGVCAPPVGANPEDDEGVDPEVNDEADLDGEASAEGEADTEGGADEDVGVGGAVGAVGAELDAGDGVLAADVDCVPVGVPTEAGLVAVGRAFAADAVGVLPGRAVGAVEVGRAADCIVPEGMAEGLAAAFGCVPAPP